VIETASRTIRASGLVKRYRDTLAVDGLDLSATAGSCLGILGPNGAGKTTTVEMLEGLIAPDAGTIELLGLVYAEDAAQIRRRIGVQLQEALLPDRLRVIEVLRVFRSLYAGGLGRLRGVEEMLGVVGLVEKRRALVFELSGGQRQRLSLACALVNEPEILFLDEPTTGLDPTARREVWAVVEAFKAQGGTVVLTTHFMEEAERLADQVLILDRGKALRRGTPAELVAALGAERVLELALRRADGAEPAGDEALRAIGALPDVTSVRAAQGRVRIGVRHFEHALPALVAWLQAQGLALDDLAVHRPTLDDVFVTLTGRQIGDA
jgi:ABC-2 type transport system ATP-binding protein